MISSKDIPALIKKCEVIYFTVFDLDNNQLFKVDGETSAKAAAEWNDILRYLTGYKTIIVDAGTKGTREKNGGKKFTWEVRVSEEKNNEQVSGVTKGMMNQAEIQAYINNAISGLEKDYKIKELEAKLAKADPDASEGAMWAGILKEVIGVKGSTLHGPDNLDVKDKTAVAAQLEALMESIRSEE